MAMMALRATRPRGSGEREERHERDREPRARRGQGRRRLRLLARFAPLIFLIALMVLFAIMEPRFLSSINLFNVMRQVSITGLLAVGMTFVILTAGIDLSIGSLVAFAGLVAAAVAKGGMQDRFTVGEGGAGYGWAAGGAGGDRGRARRRLHAGPRDHAAQGAAVRRDARRHVGVPRRGAAVRRRRADLRLRAVFTWWGQGKIGPVPVPVIIFLLAAVLAHIVLRYTRYGRKVYAVGGNPEAARLSGLNVDRIMLQRLRDHGLLRRPRRLRAGGAAQFGRGGRRHRLRADGDRLGRDRRHQPVRRRRARSSAR